MKAKAIFYAFLVLGVLVGMQLFMSTVRLMTLKTHMDVYKKQIDQDGMKKPPQPKKLNLY